MVVQHLMGFSPITEITAVITSASVAGFRTWTWLRRSAAAEHARTLRLVAALRGAPDQDHAEVVRALAELEAAIGSASSFAAKRRRPSPGKWTRHSDFIEDGAPTVRPEKRERPARYPAQSAEDL
jgi:hypothetical protein